MGSEWRAGIARVFRRCVGTARCGNAISWAISGLGIRGRGPGTMFMLLEQHGILRGLSARDWGWDPLW